MTKVIDAAKAVENIQSGHTLMVGLVEYGSVKLCAAGGQRITTIFKNILSKGCVGE
ncbi:hypothetical protein [Scopulibacillus cellulosilyticus]|uniref:Uncharacterized protein n=1 Tax=Scopulibacillus cellulosilyticus TaxID=2665665 RepID=A0ABW2PUH0_9BACL